MKTFLKIVLLVFICILVGSSLFSLLGAVLGVTFGAVGTALGFVWRVIFSPAMLVVLIVWIVSRIVKAQKRGRS